MSMQFVIVADTISEAVATLREIADALDGSNKNIAQVSVVAVDNNGHSVQIETASGANPPAQTCETPFPVRPVSQVALAPEAPSTPQQLMVEQMLPILTDAYRNGMKEKIVALRDALGLQLLSHAKEDKHGDALRAFIAAEDLA